MSKTIETINLLSASPGTQRQLKVHRYGVKGSRPKVYVQASLHADEYPAMLVAHHLIAQLDQLERDSAITGEIVVVPVANPIGLSQRVNDQHLGRYELAGGGNFNRNWPDLTAAVLQHIEGRLNQDSAQNVEVIREALRAEVEQLEVRRELDDLRKALLRDSIDADLVLDLHCDCEALPHLYSSVHHQARAEQLCADLQARVLLMETEAGGSPFDECNAGVWWKLQQALNGAFPVPLACFSTTVEFRGQLDVDDALATEDARALIRFMQRQNAVSGDPGPLPELLCEATPLEGTDLIYAPVAGLVVYRKQLGDWVEADEVVAEMVNPLADTPEQARIALTSKTSGLFFAHMIDRFVAPGAALAKVAGADALKHRKQGKLLET